MDKSKNSLRAIFNEAIELPAGPERGAFLTRACEGNNDLRGRVEELIEAHDRVEGFMDDPTQEPAKKTIVLSLPVSEKPGDRIGRYKILQQIGEGGCGVVYMAQQEEPVRRRVALKVIKLGMDTRSVIARFEAERQALALMDHPNIAKVLDAGATETGRPYFVMELVRGVRITDYCDEAKLSTAERLDLFIQVCHAIQHAHQKGIIHRDLKPSNILVTVNDGVPVPKVIDFGIAKATSDQRLTDKTLFTAYEQFIGTPAYMSPEQAVMTSLDIDTRSDIYALGVLLYELLTGRPPFDPKALLQAGFDEMRRTIREKEPERPSTCLSTMIAADLTTVANRRKSDAPKLIHMLSGDLDWIVMKALEKDRTRRYETANAMALDIRRYRDSEPIEARPPSTIYRFEKLIRRNKTVVAAGGAVMAALVLGLGLSLFLFIRERRAHHLAVMAEQEQAKFRRKAEEMATYEKRKAELSQRYAQIGLYLGQNRFEEAENMLRAMPPNAAAAGIFNVLGRVHAAMGQWPEAISNFVQVIESVPNDHMAYHYLAPLLLQNGDTEGYRQHRQRILQQFGGTNDPMICERMTKDCLLLAPASSEMPAITAMADRAIAAGETDKLWPYFTFAKGLAEYRRGDWNRSMEWMQKTLDRKGDVFRKVAANMVVAMAQFRLKQVDQAKLTLQASLDMAAAELPLRKNAGERWNDWLTTQFLMREAQELIEGK